MDKLKKLNGSMIAAIVLSVLLIMSVTAGATLAWFASRDSATASLTMGEAVVVTIGEDYRQGDGSLAMTLPVPAGQGLLPGMSITPNIRVHLQKSNTNALVRARFITTAEFPDNYEDAAYSDHAKYPDGSGEGVSLTAGRVLAPATFPNDHVYSGTIHYDYYNAVGDLINGGVDKTVGTSDDSVFETVSADSHSVTKTLKRVKVRQALVDALNDEGPTGAEDTWTINGVTVEVTDANIAELEIRQRSVDLTDAINRVLAGQRGYGIHPETGEPALNDTIGTKYTRRVADGWAYRSADQAWYYLGSQTNGFQFSEDAALTYGTGTGDNAANQYPDEVVPETGAVSAAKDITKYTATTVGNVSVQRPTYENWTYTNSTGTGDKTRNYLGGTDKDNSMNVVANEIAVLNQTTMASVDLSKANVEIEFLTKRFVLPTFINNDYAQAKVSFKFTVEAVQDYLVDPLQEATSAADRLPNNLVNAILVFNNAFPQAFTDQGVATEEAKARTIAATGAVTNVVPGGGIPSTVLWDPDDSAADGKQAGTTLDYTGYATGVKPADSVMGGLYSYGFLTDVVIGGAEYSYDDPTKRQSSVAEASREKVKAQSKITGFGTRVDDYGDIVADYSKTGEAYVRGTASSLGVNPATGTGETGYTYTPVAAG